MESTRRPPRGQPAPRRAECAVGPRTEGAAKRGRGLKSSWLGARETAWGLRTQKCEIKNKKPTVSESHAMPALLHQLRRGCAKMIRFESLGENFRAFRGIHQRCCTRRHRRRASNFVVTVSNLNRFESLPAESQCRTRAVRGGGGLNPWAVWGPLPHGVSRADFFWSARGLNYFPEIKEINRPSANRSRASRVFSRHWIRCLGRCRVRSSPRRVFIFHDRCVGGGGQKSGTFKPGPRGYLAQVPADFPETFFAPCTDDPSLRSFRWVTSPLDQFGQQRPKG
jgi:hypothetical protein